MWLSSGWLMSLNERNVEKTGGSGLKSTPIQKSRYLCTFRLFRLFLRDVGFSRAIFTVNLHVLRNVVETGGSGLKSTPIQNSRYWCTSRLLRPL